MATDQTGEGAELERLTMSAKDAARQGRWDLVDECYQARGAAMQGASISPQDAERMLAMDREVQEQALAAKTALAELLGEALAVRLRLSRLRSEGGARGTIGIEA